MALRKALAQRLYNVTRAPSPALTKEHSPISSHSSLQSMIPPNAAKTNFHREYLTSPESDGNGFFRRFFQRRSMYQSSARLPEFLSLPVGEKLKEKLRSMTLAGDRLRLDGLSPPAPAMTDDSINGISVHDARKLLRLSKIEMLKSTLRQIPRNSISYDEFVRICVEGVENEDQGVEFAKMLDESGSVIVLGNVVFIRPEQVAKSMESIISQSIATPNDPRRKELDQMEKQKALIDGRATSLVRGELYCGLGFLVLQTLGFMRLTFWELSWDVMEPICFFVASIHCAVGYGFYLRTSKEPSFEGYFQRRFKSKQKRLMEVNNFDVEKYSELCKAFYPNYGQSPPSLDHFPSSKYANGGAFAGVMHH